jgi:hypothetical protein
LQQQNQSGKLANNVYGFRPSARDNIVRWLGDVKVNEPIDWSSGWTTLSGVVPNIAEIEHHGVFKKCFLTTRVLRVEVECNKTICDFVLALKPGIDLNDLSADLNQNSIEKPFSIVQDMIDKAWEGR